MFEINGKYNSAIAYAQNLDNACVGQITALCNQFYTEGQKLRIMPDAHAGKGCVIGTTMTITDKIVPNLVGVDISCGMEVVNIGQPNLDFPKLDTVIRETVPSGFSIRANRHRFADEWDPEELNCRKIIDRSKALRSIGTLGGGNHFIELSHDKDSGNYYLVIHSGSRHTGLLVAEHYQKLAAKNCTEETPFPLSYVKDKDFSNYIHDMKLMQKYAELNRKAMADEICKGMNWQPQDSFTTVHNYLDTDNMILRKGAVSAQKGERLLIPMNMRDGSLICEGLGNPDWNYSAPHGAGRIYSRKGAKENLTLTQFQKDMEGIYSTCVTSNTLDESPGAYKPMEEIISQISDTVKVCAMLKPVYNFKAGA